MLSVVVVKVRLAVLNQAGDDIPTFTHQNIIGSAGSTGIHKIDADALLNNCRIRFDFGKYKSITSTNDDELRLEQ